MADYIDRDLTIQYLCEACSNFEGNICTLSEECEDIRIIRAMSAENVQPVRHGRWVTITVDGESDTICTHCYETMLYGRTDYCPHCGADMRGEGNG